MMLAGPSIIDGYYRNMVLVAGLNGIILLSIATASWYLFEQPINGMKRRFQLRDESKARVAVTSISRNGGA